MDKKQLKQLFKAAISGDWATPKAMREETKQKQWFEAAAIGDAEKLKELTRAGYDMEAKDELERTALMYAAGKGHDECVRVLIESGCNVNAKTPGGLTALMWAAGNGHDVCVGELIRAGGDLDAKDEAGQTAAIWAAACKQPGCLLMLQAAAAAVEECALKASVDRPPPSARKAIRI